MLITRRTLVLGAVASALAACSSGSSKHSGGGGGRQPSGGDGGDGGVAAGDGSSGTAPAGLPPSIAMVGDSITALSKEALQAVLTQMGFADITINAEPSRRIEVGSKKPMPGLDVVRFIQASSPPAMWVIALGTNDAGLYAKDEEYQGLIDDVLGSVPDDVPLVWVSTYRDDQLKGCEQFNLLMRRALKDRGHAAVAEWYQQVSKSKGKILTQDGVHPNADGILVFADTVRAGITAELS